MNAEFAEQQRSHWLWTGRLVLRAGGLALLALSLNSGRSPAALAATPGSQVLPAPTVQLAGDRPHPLAATPDPEALATAQSLRTQGDWLGAAQRYRDILSHSQGETAAQAQLELGELLIDLGQDEAAVPLLNAALAHYRQTDQLLPAASGLIHLGAAYNHLERSFLSVEHLQQGLSLLGQLGDQPIGQTLAYRESLSQGIFEAGKTHLLLGKTEDSLPLLQESARLAAQLNDPVREAGSLNLLAYAQLLSKQSEAAQQTLTQGRSRLTAALTETPTVQPPAIAARLTSLQGANFFFAGELESAIAQYEAAARAYQALGYQTLASDQLNLMGNVYSVMPRYGEAIALHQRAYQAFKAQGDRRRMVENLSSLSTTYALTGDVGKMLAAKQEALALVQDLRRSLPEPIAPLPDSEAELLAGIGEAQVGLGQYAEAEASFLAATKLYDQLAQQTNVLPESQQQQADSWRKLGDLYQRRGKIPEALAALTQALQLAETGNHPMVAAQSQIVLGSIYAGLGDMDQAQAMLAAARSFDPSSLVPVTFSLPLAFDNLGNELLSLARQAQSPQFEAIALIQLANDYESAGDLPRALATEQQILQIYQAQGNRTQEAWQWQGVGQLQFELQQYEAARQSFEQMALVAQGIGDRNLERQAYFFLGQILEAQGQPELAIVFYKQFVNVTEALRGQLASLSRNQREGFQRTYAGSYRHLADLLLARDRVIEAQEVLDLLKLQEVEDFLRDDYQVAQRGQTSGQTSDQTSSSLTVLRPEQEILAQYGALQQSAVALGQELATLRQLAEEQRSPQQRQRLTQIIALQDQLNQQFQGFLQNRSILVQLEQLSRNSQRQSLDLNQLDSLRQDLGQLDAAMLYPLVLEDRLELIITTPHSPPLRRTVPVGAAELNRAIVAFRQALQNPTRNATGPAQQLYRWLIEPLEADLSQAQLDKIIYAPDGPLRYVPLGALHDGEGWLIERFAVNNITSKSLTSLTKQPLREPKLLAGAFADPGLSYAMEVGDRRLGFGGLPFAGLEVEALGKMMPGSIQLLNEQFSPGAVKPQLENHGIIHFATHAAFVPGDPSDSFIVFGNGDRVTLKDLNSWSLNNVDLVVLSACETGLGGQLGNGEEILGLGYQFQQRGAKAAVASLWQVDDGGTQALMTAFYEGLQGGEMTKLEALQAAQLRLIGSEGRGAGQSRFAFKPPELPEESAVEVTALSHPYYWAPFILIGNGL